MKFHENASDWVLKACRRRAGFVRAFAPHQTIGWASTCFLAVQAAEGLMHLSADRTISPGLPAVQNGVEGWKKQHWRDGKNILIPVPNVVQPKEPADCPPVICYHALELFIVLQRCKQKFEHLPSDGPRSPDRSRLAPVSFGLIWAPSAIDFAITITDAVCFEVERIFGNPQRGYSDAVTLPLTLNCEEPLRRTQAARVLVALQLAFLTKDRGPLQISELFRSLRHQLEAEFSWPVLSGYSNVITLKPDKLEIIYGGEAFSILLPEKNTVLRTGSRVLMTLIANQGERISDADLVGVYKYGSYTDTASSAKDSTNMRNDAAENIGVDGIGEDPVIDAEAEQVYKERMKELVEIIQEPGEDDEVKQKAKQELDFIHESINKARGKSSKSGYRKLSRDEATKVRELVTKAVRAVVNAIKAENVHAGIHFEQSIPAARDGGRVYSPIEEIEWKIMHHEDS